MSPSAHAHQENKMGVMPIGRLLFTMSGPMMISMLIQALYNVVDSMFVSYISESALTAVSLAYPVQNLMIAVATGTGVGVNALLSRNLGEKNFVVANRTAGNAIFLGLISSVVFTILGIFGSRAFFAVQVTDPEVIALGRDYLFFIMLFSVGCFGQVLLSRLLQSTGKTFYSMVIQVVGAILNIILDPLFIFGLGPFPALGVKGAAIATVLSQLVGTAMGIYYNLKKNKEITFTRENIKPSAPIISRIYSVGVPSILLQTVASVLIFGLNQILVAFTKTATAVYGVFFKLQGFAFLPIIGMNNGMVPIIAYNYGARKPERIIKTIRLAMTTALTIMIVAVIIFQFLPDKLLGIFQASDDMLAIGVPALRTLSWSFLFGGITIVLSSVFQALGRGIQSMLISIFRQLLIVLPLAYLLSKTGNLNLIWWAFPVSDVLALIFAGYLLMRTYRQVIQPLADEGFTF